MALASTYVEPPAGIEPATPSLPWNHQEPLCEPPFPQLTPDRQGQSYRFSFDAGMRSLSKHVLVVSGVSRNPHLENHEPDPDLGGPTWMPSPRQILTSAD